MDAWQSLLLVLGGNAALLLVLRWLARSLGSQLLAKDLEQFKPVWPPLLQLRQNA